MGNTLQDLLQNTGLKTDENYSIDDMLSRYNIDDFASAVIAVDGILHEISEHKITVNHGYNPHSETVTEALDIQMEPACLKKCHSLVVIILGCYIDKKVTRTELIFLIERVLSADIPQRIKGLVVGQMLNDIDNKLIKIKEGN